MRRIAAGTSMVGLRLAKSCMSLWRSCMADHSQLLDNGADVALDIVRRDKRLVGRLLMWCVGFLEQLICHMYLVEELMGEICGNISLGKKTVGFSLKVSDLLCQKEIIMSQCRAIACVIYTVCRLPRSTSSSATPILGPIVTFTRLSRGSSVVRRDSP